ncbi:radical SAM family heme chaperone HemW [Methylomonas rhizoryzae]|uniref:radical SAM family heme chaperone HemW n=1 Tax=Methylomonas rhizoryzae TaxID=2608981 RepID=UPI0012329EC7|nr:radical SAM family heme chaperone HemW [Methylomonas rhizoryzae]
MPPLSLYIHFPWCLQKCPYCDFNSHALKQDLPEERYIAALLDDLRVEIAALPQPRRIESIFMGGGTPSLFSAAALERLLKGVKALVELADDCEITLEANPGTFESAKFSAYRELGINRLSIGIQSFDDAQLARLGRVHNAEEAFGAAQIARDAGFDNLNLDLMFGLPEQTEHSAIADVAAALSLKPTHISYYQLTLEPNTYFHRYPPQLPDDETIFTHQQRCQDLLAKQGYKQYEISAYALPDFQCRHNRNYWQFGDYLGIGAGAHGKLSLAMPGHILRTTKPKNPEQYWLNPAGGSRAVIAQDQLSLEFVMNALRLKSGFSLADFQAATGLAVDVLQPALAQCLEAGLLARHGERVACSAVGWNFLDSVLQKFLP